MDNNVFGEVGLSIQLENSRDDNNTMGGVGSNMLLSLCRENSVKERQEYEGEGCMSSTEANNKV